MFTIFSQQSTSDTLFRPECGAKNFCRAFISLKSQCYYLQVLNPGKDKIIESTCYIVIYAFSEQRFSIHKMDIRGNTDFFSIGAEMCIDALSVAVILSEVKNETFLLQLLSDHIFNQFRIGLTLRRSHTLSDEKSQRLFISRFIIIDCLRIAG